jgi:glycosyltransferase involved in cell wall biosynthesis
MKILHLTKKYPNALGGDAVVVYNLEKQQEKVGHKVFILTSNCPEIVEKENVFKFGLRDTASNQDKITFRRIISLFILLFWGFKYIKKLKPDVIHSHSADLGFFISFSARLYRIPVVNTCHGVTFPDKQYGFMKRFAEKFFLEYGGFKKIITVDKSSLKFFKEAEINNVTYIPNGVDIERFDRQGVEKKNDQKIRFLFVGRLESEKGLKYLFHAVKLLQGRTKNFDVLLVGDGAQRKRLEILAQSLDIEEYVQFKGKVNMNSVTDIYRNSDVFVLPSIHEGFGIVNLEAMASGLPIIATNVGGVPEIIKDGENGLLVEPKDSKALAKLGETGRKLVEEKYSWARVGIDIQRVYEDQTNIGKIIKNKPNLCVLTYPFKEKSGEVILTNLIKILEQISNKILLISSGINDAEKFSNVEYIVKWATGRNQKNSIFNEIFRHVMPQLIVSKEIFRNRRRFDTIIFFIGASVYVVPALVSKMLRKKTILLLSGRVSSTVKQDFRGYKSEVYYAVSALNEKILYKLVDKIIIYGLREDENVLSNYGLSKYKCKVFSTGARFVDDRFNKRIVLEERESLVGFVGRLNKGKGVIELVDSIKNLLNEGQELKFVFIGDGALYRYVKDELEDFIKSGKVDVKGWVAHNKLPDYYNKMKLLILPSYSEGLPNIVLEAMACGTPVLATPVGSLLMLIKDGETGFLLEKNTQEEIGKKIVSLMDNQEKLNEVAKNAAELIEREFRLDGAIERYKKLI